MKGIQPHLKAVLPTTRTCCNLSFHIIFWLGHVDLIIRPCAVALLCGAVFLVCLQGLGLAIGLVDRTSSLKMSAQFPVLSQLGIYRVSNEKQETLIKLMILSICAILCKSVHHIVGQFVSRHVVVVAFSTRLFAVLRFESVIHEFDP